LDIARRFGIFCCAVWAGALVQRASAAPGPSPAEAPALPISASAQLISRAAVRGPLARLPAAPRPAGQRAAEPDGFWAYDTFLGTYYRLAATRRHVSPMGSIYLEDGVRVPDEVIRELAETYEDVVYPTLRQAFGPRLGRQWDGRGEVTVLLLDIRDPLTHGASAATYVAGYFDPANEFSQAELDRLGGGLRSNERHMIYLDVAPPGKPKTVVLRPTLAHELAHLVHYGYDPDEEAWLSEAFSELAVYRCGFGHPMGHVFEFLAAPEAPLVAWTGTPGDYGKVYLFALYLLEQLDSGDGRWLRDWLRDPSNGLASLQAALPAARPLPALFRDYALALFADDATLADGRYAFRSLELSPTGSPYAVHAVAHEHAGGRFGLQEVQLAPWSLRADRVAVVREPLEVALQADGPICVGALWPLGERPAGTSASLDTPCLAPAQPTVWAITPDPQPGSAMTVLTVSANAGGQATPLLLAIAPLRAGVHGRPGTPSHRLVLPLVFRR
jgi:hypothetical protein